MKEILDKTVEDLEEMIAKDSSLLKAKIQHTQPRKTSNQ